MGTKTTSSTAFLNKLWKLVNDPLTDDLITWAPNGRSFIITDQTRFTQELVPKYFKHNNMQSFIRQLNLYGFRKVSSVEIGGLTADKGEIEFYHQYFIRGKVELTEHIKRKSQNSRGITSEGNQNISDILRELQKVQLNQESMKTQITELKKENDLLWRQYSTVRIKFSKQQKVIEKLVRFMLTMMDRRKQLISKKKLQLALEGDADSSSGIAGHRNPLKLEYEPKKLLSITGPEEPAGAVIHEVTNLDSNEGIDVLLDKIFPDSAQDNGPFVSDPFGAENIASSNVIRNSLLNAKMEPMDNPFFGQLDEDLYEGNEYSNTTSNIPPSVIFTSSSPLIVTTTATTTTTMPTISESTGTKLKQTYINDPLFVRNDPRDLTGLIKDDNIPSSTGIVTVQSPNGTILQDSSPPLSPEIMDVVDPSLVNPNIIVPLPNEHLQHTQHQPQPQQTQLNNITGFKKPQPTYPSSYSGSKVISSGKMNKGHPGKFTIRNSSEVTFPNKRRGKSKNINNNVSNDFSNVGYLQNDLVPNISQDIYEDALIPTNSISSLSSKERNLESKNERKLLTPNYVDEPNQRPRPVNLETEANLKPNNNISIHTNSQENNSGNFNVSAPNRSLTRADLENHSDEVQNLLDTLKEYFQASNIDRNTLLSLFNENDPVIPMPESDPSSSNILGNEVSIYHPSFLDDDEPEVGLNFASLVEEDEDDDGFPNKKMKPINELVSKEEGLETPQPHRTTFNFRNS